MFFFFVLRGVCVGVWNELQASLFESIFYFCGKLTKVVSLELSSLIRRMAAKHKQT